jgi:hypothetical protein
MAKLLDDKDEAVFDLLESLFDDDFLTRSTLGFLLLSFLNLE